MKDSFKKLTMPMYAKDPADSFYNQVVSVGAESWEKTTSVNPKVDYRATFDGKIVELTRHEYVSQTLSKVSDGIDLDGLKATNHYSAKVLRKEGGHLYTFSPVDARDLFETIDVLVTAAIEAKERE